MRKLKLREICDLCKFIYLVRATTEFRSINPKCMFFLLYHMLSHSIDIKLLTKCFQKGLTINILVNIVSYRKPYLMQLPLFPWCVCVGGCPSTRACLIFLMTATPLLVFTYSLLMADLNTCIYLESLH